jgi:folate-dependent phosphoribosylglycinamide formyltransferase PurN
MCEVKNEPMQHLVFVAKWIGARCVEYMLDTFPKDNYTIIVCEPEADMIVSMIERRGLPYMRLNEDSLKRIQNMEEGYYDWLLNLWGGYIFKDDIISRARHSLNIHPAFLPYCRGRDPIVWAIRKGYPAGVTLHAITKGVDEGSIWYQEEVPYQLPVIGGELYRKVVARCWKSFCEQWSKLRDGNIIAKPQIPSEDSTTFRRSDLMIDRCINIDSVGVAEREVILRLLAHDFSPDYSAQVVINDQFYNATLSLSLVDDTKSK